MAQATVLWHKGRNPQPLFDTSIEPIDRPEENTICSSSLVFNMAANTPQSVQGHVPLFAPTELSAHAQQAVASRGNPATLNLDDIFGDVLFTPDGETIFLDEAPEQVLPSGEDQVATVASRPTDEGRFVPVPLAGGLTATNLHRPGERSTIMGGTPSAPTPAVPFKQPPQQRHHLQYATPAQIAAAKNKRKGAGGRADRKMSEQQKVERR